METLWYRVIQVVVENGRRVWCQLLMVVDILTSWPTYFHVALHIGQHFCSATNGQVDVIQRRHGAGSEPLTHDPTRPDTFDRVTQPGH